MSDPIADLLTRLRNGGNAQLTVVEVPHSKMKEGISLLLKREGYIADVTVEGTVKKTIKLRLKYEGRKCIIDGLQRVSRPGLRRYVGSTEIPKVRNGMGTAILSTPTGIVTGSDALRNNTGGELLCYVW